MSVSLFSLSGLPPSPLFVSEVMILLGGMDAGLTAISSIAAVLLALGFLGLAHALLEGLLGTRRGPRPRPSRSAQAVAMLAGAAAVALIALTVAAYALPGSDVVAALMRSGA
jgi:formate hydrogenlyase subunit 3/multisubunit Na+/H+ antiporter MnhD subunit